MLKKILCFGAKLFVCLVAQLENNPKSIAQPKVFPLHRFEFAKLVLVSAIETLERILPQERTLLEGQNLQDIQQAWIPNIAMVVMMI